MSTKRQYINKSNSHSRSIEIMVSFILQLGVIVSGTLIIIGLLGFLDGLKISSYMPLISSNFNFPHSLKQMTYSLHQNQPIGLLVLGIILLILTPVFRVATSILIFLFKKDIPMTLVTLTVLIILIASFFIGTASK